LLTGNGIEFPTSIIAIIYLTRPYVKAFYRNALGGPRNEKL